MPRGYPNKPAKRVYRTHTGNGRRRSIDQTSQQVIHALNIYIADLEKKLLAARRLHTTLQRSVRKNKY